MTATVSTAVTVAETFVMNVVAQVKNDVAVAIADANQAAMWIAQEIPTVVPLIEDLETFAAAIPNSANNPDIQVAIQAANVAVESLNSFQAASAAGGNAETDVAAAVVTGYTAVNSAKAAIASAKATISQAPAASAPATTAA
jgi:hypothetical protein